MARNEELVINMNAHIIDRLLAREQAKRLYCPHFSTKRTRKRFLKNTEAWRASGEDCQLIEYIEKHNLDDCEPYPSREEFIEHWLPSIQYIIEDVFPVDDEAARALCDDYGYDYRTVAWLHNWGDDRYGQ